MIPGLTRRMAEHRGGLLAELEHHRSSVEAPLLKSGNGAGSFGHHILTTEETLYRCQFYQHCTCTFLYKSALGSFSLITVWLCDFW